MLPTRSQEEELWHGDHGRQALTIQVLLEWKRRGIRWGRRDGSVEVVEERVRGRQIVGPNSPRKNEHPQGRLRVFVCVRATDQSQGSRKRPFL